MTQVLVGNADTDLKDHDFAQLIDGELVAGERTVEVLDPATEQAVGISPVASEGQVDAAVAAAKRAFESWGRTTFEQRQATVRGIIDRIMQHQENIARMITLETGKPIAAAQSEVDLALMWAEHVSNIDLAPEVLKDDADAYIEMRYRPLGVVVAIVPWNFPFFQTVYKIIPALMTGNTVVLKPAPTAPLNGMYLGEIIQDVVPAGVVNVVGDDGGVGPQLTAHPDVAKVSFTGSTAAGRSVMASGAPTLKRIVLELGGNDAAIVLDDVDVDATVEQIYSWAFMNTGQVCINIKRIFVPGSIFEEFAEKFAERANRAVLGHGLDPSTELGPVQNARQFAAAQRYLKHAVEDGTVIAGGEIVDGPGYFVRPTVVRDVKEDSPLIREETFGPVRTLIRYDDLDDAVRRANDTEYGLGNSVWGTDIEKATKIANRLESGTVWVNTHFALDPGVPFGGHKQSGKGFEFGRDGLEEFTNKFAVHVNKKGI